MERSTFRAAIGRSLIIKPVLCALPYRALLLCLTPFQNTFLDSYFQYSRAGPWHIFSIAPFSPWYTIRAAPKLILESVTSAK